MTSYEIKLTASHESVIVILDSSCDTIRATTETLETVRNTVITKCDALLVAHRKTIDKLTANIYEVTDMGNLVFVGYMYFYDKNVHVPVLTTKLERQMYKLVLPKKNNIELGYRMTYVNIDDDRVVDHRMCGDDTVMVFYSKRFANYEAVDQILEHLRHNCESIHYRPNHLASVRTGRKKYNRIVSNDGFIFCMGEAMYERLYSNIMIDEDLKPRFVE